LEAVQKAEELQPDLILLDVGLPILNGIEVAKRVRQLIPRTKILFVSQESSPDVVHEAFQSGALGYVIKSRAGRDLFTAIEAVLSGKRFVSGSDGYELSDEVDSRVPQRHEILFSSDDASVIDGLARFITAALNAGDGAIVWATQSHRDGIRRQLQTEGIDVDAAIQRGTYIAADVSEPPDSARMVQAIRTVSEAAPKAGKEYPSVAICGERAGLLWAEGKIDEAIRLEQLINELARIHELKVFCTYPGFPRDGDDHGFKSICAEHSAVHFR